VLDYEQLRKSLDKREIDNRNSLFCTKTSLFWASQILKRVLQHHEAVVGKLVSLQVAEDVSRSKGSSTAIQFQNRFSKALWHCRIEWRNLTLSDCRIIASDAEMFGSEKSKNAD
jgi:hypothetical protein